MHTVKTDVDRSNCDLVDDFEGISSSIISDVAGNMRTTMGSGIKPVDSGTQVAGIAFTVKALPGDNLIIHKAITMAEPGDVLVIDGGGYTETAYLGELMCASCQAHEIAGVVIDGAIRDCDDVAEMGFPLYARGVHPQGPTKQYPGSINVTVSCGGVTVTPGDIVVGDAEGVAVIPANDAEAVLKRAHEKLATEETLLERVEDGEYLYEIGGHDETFESLNVSESAGSTE